MLSKDHSIVEEMESRTLFSIGIPQLAALPGVPLSAAAVDVEAQPHVAAQEAQRSISTVAPSATTTTTTNVAARADAHVRDGAYAKNNYGQATTLEVKKAFLTGYSRQAYLQFDLRGVGSASDITSAKVRLFGKLLDTAASTMQVGLYAVASTTWTESGLTWNNKPAAGASLGVVTVAGTAGKWYEFDVTNYLKQQKAAGATAVSFMLNGTVATGEFAGFNSDEATSNKPQLTVTQTPATPQALVVSTASLSVPEGSSGSFTVKLAAAPTANVIVDVTKQPQGDPSIDASVNTLTFTPANWNTPQTVVISAAQDPDSDNGWASFEITSPGLDFKSIDVSAIDDDVSAPAEITLRSGQDTFARDGTYVGTNFGQGVTLEVKNARLVGYSRRSYLRFDLTGVGAANDITSANLRLFGKLLNTAVSSASIGLYPVANATWTESALNWNNKPAAGAIPLAAVTVTGTAGAWYTVNVTDYLKQQKAAGATAVAFQLAATTIGEGWAGFNSDEATSNKPELSVMQATEAPPPQTGFSAHVNFQPDWVPVPAGYVPDNGLTYADRGNGLAYGWDLPTGRVSRDLSNSPDVRYDTFSYLQKPSAGTTWEIGVPNGTYQVHLVTGDALYYGSIDRVNVEGVLAVNATTTSTTRWAEGTVTVTVTDGRLTITAASGASNAKIDFVDITSIETGGWTNLSPSADSKIIYVDNTPGGPGKDTNNGLSPQSPFFSWSKAVSALRPNAPDWILVKRGTTFNTAIVNWDLSGRSAQEPMVIGSYGDPSLPRPKFVTGSAAFGFSTESRLAQVSAGVRVQHVALTGLEFTPGQPDTIDVRSTGFSSVGATQDLLIEDCMFRGYQDNISLQDQLDPTHAPLSNVRIRRSVIADSYGVGTLAADNGFKERNQGLFADGVDGLLLEENVFDHNGWNESVPTAVPNMFSHNIYLQITNDNVRVLNNIIARSSGHGLQVRCGGTVEGNVFIDDPFSISFGYINVSPARPNGVVGDVKNNVILGARDVPWDQGEWAIEVANTAVNGHVAISNNVIVGNTQGDKAAIRVRVTGNTVNQSEDAGINDLTIEHNTIYGWPHGIETDAAFIPGATGQFGLNGLIVRNNDFQNILFSPTVDHAGPYSASSESWSNNRYTAPGGPTFHLNTTPTPLTIAQWQQLVEPTASAATIDYVDPTRTAATYNATLGGAATDAAFLTAARAQSKAHWLAQYTAAPLAEYVRAGFAAQSGV